MDHGFEIYPNVLTEDECRNVADELAQPNGIRGRAGKRHLMSNGLVEKLAGDERLLSIAKGCVGKRATPYRATLFEKSGRANWLVVWHQDTALPLRQQFDSAEWGPWSTKEGVHYAHAPSWALERVVALRVHLDSSTTSNGPLRVVPGSHLLGVLEDGDVFAHAHKHNSVECTVPIGGVLAMRPLLIHASSKVNVDTPRRVLHIEYADTLELNKEACLAIA